MPASPSDGINFGTDRRIAQLASSGTIEPHLIVAIDNLGRNRFLQYMPQTIYEQARGELREGIDLELARHDGRPLQSDALLRHLTSRLKPFVDENYRTQPGRLDSAIFGASMAGVMAGAIFVEAQHVFGRGACVSPNWPIYDSRFVDYNRRTFIGSEWLEPGGEPPIRSGRTFRALPRHPINSASLHQCNAFDVAAVQR